MDILKGCSSCHSQNEDLKVQCESDHNTFKEGTNRNIKHTHDYIQQTKLYYSHMIPCGRES